jgi:hypothetical protein
MLQRRVGRYCLLATGIPTSSYAQNGESKIFPARYSFTYVKYGDHWMIVDHHPSAMPSPPK